MAWVLYLTLVIVMLSPTLLPQMCVTNINILYLNIYKFGVISC